MRYFLLTFIFFGSIYSLSAQTQLEMNMAASEEFKIADKQLNLTYNKLIKLLEPKEKSQLVDVQKSWIKYKEAHCKFEADQYEGGSIQPLIWYSCLQKITEQRNEYLQNFIKEREE